MFFTRYNPDFVAFYLVRHKVQNNIGMRIKVGIWLTEEKPTSTKMKKNEVTKLQNLIVDEPYVSYYGFKFREISREDRLPVFHSLLET